MYQKSKLIYKVGDVDLKLTSGLIAPRIDLKSQNMICKSFLWCNMPVSDSSTAKSLEVIY